MSVGRTLMEPDGRPQEDAWTHECLAAYDLGTVTRTQTLTGGMFLRPTLIETDRGRYVLRAHTFRNDAPRFRFQAEAVNYAADQGFPCPRVLPRTDGRWGIVRRGAFWAVHEYAEGDVLDWPRWYALKREHPAALERLGAHIASLHDVLAAASIGGEPSLSHSVPAIRFHRLVACMRHFRAQVGDLPDRPAAFRATISALKEPRILAIWEIVIQAAARLRAGCLPRQPVHGDVSPVNMVWCAETDGHERMPTLIDWDCTHVGLRLYDALGDVLIRAPFDMPQTHRFDAEEVRTYLRGYASATRHPFAPEELACVPLFLMARQLEDLRQRAAAIAWLPSERDEEFAALVRMRIGFLEQIRPYLDDDKGPYSWI